MSAKRLQGYLEFLRQDPNNLFLIIQACEIAINDKVYDKASLLIQKGELLEPDNFKIAYLKATLSMHMGNFDSAIDGFYDLLEKRRHDPAVIYSLTLSLLHENRPLQAYQVIDPQLAETAEALPKAMLAYARCCHHIGDLDRALTALEKYLNQNEDCAEGQGLKALLNFDIGNDKNIEAAIEKALHVDPANYEANLSKGLLALIEYNLVLAEQHFARVVISNPRSGRVWLGRGLVALAKEQTQQAERYLNEAVKLLPEHIGTLVAYAWCKVAALKTDEAQKLFRQCIAKSSGFAEGYAGLGVALAMQNRFRDAVRYGKIAKKLAPKAISTLYLESLIKHSQGQFQEALSIAAKIPELPVVSDSETLRETMRKFHQKQPDPAFDEELRALLEAHDPNNMNDNIETD